MCNIVAPSRHSWSHLFRSNTPARTACRNKSSTVGRLTVMNSEFCAQKVGPATIQASEMTFQSIILSNMMETRRLTGDRKCSHELLTSWLGKTMQRKNGLVQLELIRCPTTKTSASCSNLEELSKLDPPIQKASREVQVLKRVAYTEREKTSYRNFPK
jgi:hypothetical protein